MHIGGGSNIWDKEIKNVQKKKFTSNKYKKDNLKC